MLFLLPSLVYMRLKKVRKPITHEVKVRATVGARGLGLILAEEKEGSRWLVKGFRPMPGGKPNPGQVALNFSSCRPCFLVSSCRASWFRLTVLIGFVVLATGHRIMNLSLFLFLGRQTQDVLSFATQTWTIFGGDGSGAVALLLRRVQYPSNFFFHGNACPHSSNTAFVSIQAAGIKAGDKLQQLGGVHLGSYKNGIELLKQQRGAVFITVRRQIF